MEQKPNGKPVYQGVIDPWRHVPLEKDEIGIIQGLFRNDLNSDQQARLVEILLYRLAGHTDSVYRTKRRHTDIMIGRQCVGHDLLYYGQTLRTQASMDKASVRAALANNDEAKQEQTDET